MDYQPGDRIALVFTADPYTKLQPGDEGTVTDCDTHFGSGVISIKWDNGSTLSMIPDFGDRVRKVEGKT
jgi:hypothetical protein